MTSGGLRIRESAQTGFARVVLPLANMHPGEADGADGCERAGVRALGEALDAPIA